jgi:hypothetical protein
MRYLIFISLLFIGCEKEPVECWTCETRDQKTDELIKSGEYCNMQWDDMIAIADSLNTFGVTYTNCKKNGR